MKYLTKVVVMPKDGVADPQGLAVKNALHSMHYQSVDEVRVGKMINLTMTGENLEEVKKSAQEFSDRLLVNPNIEKCVIEITEGEMQ
ncbi:MAG: phosphoribosylformylglycinamidine synthase subunit PurS [Chlamydiota bacterium]|nr:phosphoribosylformylglycinamidine synthase subunit PurS [Chlamydiota bacterium]